MIRIDKIICPNCGANLDDDANGGMCFCKFCGAKLQIDDGSKTINYNKTYREIDEARIKEAEVKKDIRTAELEYLNKKERRKYEKEKKGNKFTIIASALLVITLVVLMTFITIRDNKKAEWAKQNGLVSAGSHKDYEGKNYKGVVAQLEVLGFDNVDLIDLENAKTYNLGKLGSFDYVEDTIDSISINGQADFEKNDYFDPTTAKIIITYH